MPLGAGQIMRCRNEFRGAFVVHPAPFLALRAELKVRGRLPPECSFFFTAPQMLDLLMWGSPGSPPPPVLVLPASAHIGFNASIVAAAAPWAALVHFPSSSSLSASPWAKLGLRTELGCLFLCSVPPGLTGFLVLPFPFRAGL